MPTCPKCNFVWTAKRKFKTVLDEESAKLVDLINDLHLREIQSKPRFGAGIYRELRRLIVGFGVDECARRFNRAYTQHLPDFAWKRSPPTLSTLISQFDSLVEWKGGQATPEDVRKS